MDYQNYGASANVLSTGTNIKESDESPSKIRDGMTNAEQALSEIHTAIALLDKRLDTVLTPIPPQGVGSGGATPQPIASHLLGRMQLHNQALNEAVSRLRDLARRVEV